MSEVLPIDDWKETSEDKKKFFEDVKCHLSVYVEDKETRETLERLIAISLRDKFCFGEDK